VVDEKHRQWTRRKKGNKKHGVCTKRKVPYCSGLSGGFDTKEATGGGRVEGVRCRGGPAEKGGGKNKKRCCGGRGNKTVDIVVTVGSDLKSELKKKTIQDTKMINKRKRWAGKR